MVETCINESDIFLYADDAKIFKHISADMDKVKLQKDLDNISAWTDKWLLKLNVNKCKYVSYGRDNNYQAQYMLKGTNLEKLESFKDLGVTFDNKLGFGEHISLKINKAYSILGVINRNFKHLSEQCFVMLYKSMVRSHLEYAQGIWSPHAQGHIKDIEKVQMRATKMVARLKELPYQKRLESLNLPTLKYRRIRGDMIELYKIITGRYDEEASIKLNYSKTNVRGNRYRLYQGHLHYDLRKYFFVNRVIHIWNGLPDEVVAADTTNNFKTRLVNFGTARVLNTI